MSSIKWSYVQYFPYHMLIYKPMVLYFPNLLLMFLPAFCSQLRVYHLFGASIPAFRVPLVTNLYRLIHLGIKSLFIFIRSQ